MRVIGLAVALTVSLALAPLGGEAQKSEKMPHVGILGIGPAPSPQELAKSVSTNPFWLGVLERESASFEELAKRQKHRRPA